MSVVGVRRVAVCGAAIIILVVLARSGGGADAGRTDLVGYSRFPRAEFGSATATLGFHARPVRAARLSRAARHRRDPRAILRELLRRNVDEMERNIRDMTAAGGDGGRTDAQTAERQTNIEFRKKMLRELYKFWLNSQADIAHASGQRDIIEP